MKNLLSKVLVVLAVSAVFAGNIDAAQAKKGRRRSVAAQVEVSKLGFFELVQALGTADFPDDFQVWAKEARRQAIIDQYGSIDKAPRALVNYLIGTPANDTEKNRARYKDAALKAIATKGIAEITKEVKEEADRQEANPTAEGQANLQDKTGRLANMIAAFKAYVPASAITAGKIALGTGVAVLATYGLTIAADYAAQKVGYAGGYNAALMKYVGQAGTYIKETGAAFAGKIGGYATRAGTALAPYMPGIISRRLAQPAPVVTQPGIQPRQPITAEEAFEIANQ